MIPAWNWVTVKSATPSSSRVGNVLRVYLGRPWFESGIGELLGVVVASPPPGAALPSGLQPFVSGFGSDPVFTTGPVGTAKVTDFPLAVHKGISLQLEEQTSGIGWVDVAGHEVNWDKTRRLWFADIAIGAGQSYFPFVKLALVRYQPASLPGIELSCVVQADFIQLTPNRSMGLTYPSGTKVNVEVLGPGYLMTPNNRATPDTMRAYLQVKAVETSDPDLQWIIDPAQPDGTVLSVGELERGHHRLEGHGDAPQGALAPSPTGSSSPSSRNTRWFEQATSARKSPTSTPSRSEASQPRASL